MILVKFYFGNHARVRGGFCLLGLRLMLRTPGLLPPTPEIARPTMRRTEFGATTHKTDPNSKTSSAARNRRQMGTRRFYLVSTAQVELHCRIKCAIVRRLTKVEISGRSQQQSFSSVTNTNSQSSLRDRQRLLSCFCTKNETASRISPNQKSSIGDIGPHGAQPVKDDRNHHGNWNLPELTETGARVIFVFRPAGVKPGTAILCCRLFSSGIQ